MTSFIVAMVLFPGFAPAGMTVEVWQASWCPACKRMAPTVAKLQREGEPVLWIDYDRHRETAKGWNVEALPTTILIVNGREAARIVGVAGETQLRDLLRKGREKQKEVSLGERSSAGLLDGCNLGCECRG